MKPIQRPSGRLPHEMRETSVELDVNIHAEGACIINIGNTKVLCTASVQNSVPRWLMGKGKGWVTAEYGMLPRATHDRIDRESVKGKQSGRTVEISRLIGRSIRSVVDMKKLGERTIWLDCDVLQADGGTRCAAITGAFIALDIALKKLISQGKIEQSPIKENLAAISCGITKSGAVLDLDYIEDSSAIADGNFILTESGKIIEIQTTSEERPIQKLEFNNMLELAEKGIQDLTNMQKAVTEAILL